MNKVSLIVLSFNGGKDILECLESLKSEKAILFMFNFSEPWLMIDYGDAFTKVNKAV